MKEHFKSNVEDIEVLATHPIDAPLVNPTKPGYIFAGWYVGNKKWDFESNVVLKDLVIKALFSIVSP